MVSYEPWQSLVSSFKFDAVFSNPGNEISGKDIEKVTEFKKIFLKSFRQGFSGKIYFVFVQRILQIKKTNKVDLPAAILPVIV